MKKITIDLLKDIKHLEFSIPDNNGVYLIAGANGIGKTTLLVCLDRICNRIAFPNGFGSASSWNSADQYTNAAIKFEVDGKEVLYKKTQSRWSPTPRKNSRAVLNQFGFSSSVFIRADSKRIDIKQDDLKSGNLKPVDINIIEALNQIFETSKYNQLQRLKNTNGKGRSTVYFYVIQESGSSSKQYYSEKRFSTGELAMVRLVEQVESAADNTLILLDEAEMALHPRVQVNLLDYLRKKAKSKSLWFFISTHSPTMLKAAKKEEIVLLRKEGDNTEIISPCYPAQAIGDIDFVNSNIFDYIFFVEDEMAQLILKHMIQKFITQKPEHATALCNIIPVGGFYETAKLAVSTKKRVFGNSKVFAVLDQDAFEELDSKPKFNHLYNVEKSNKEIIKSLTVTPEVWLVEKIETATDGLKRSFLDKFQVEIAAIIASEDYVNCNSSKIRQKAKDRFKVIIDAVRASLCDSEERIINEVIYEVVQTISDCDIMKVINPLFK